MGQLSLSAFTPYDPTDAASIVPGPLALYSVSVDSIAPTQMNEGFTEVDKKAAAFDLETPAELQASLLTDIEPVVIGPGGVLYLTDGHHTFTALEDSICGASDPTVYVNVIANYSDLTTAEFYAEMQANNFLLPLNDDVAQTVNDATGAPIPTTLTGLTSDVYRGLEYSILKNKSSKLFTSKGNITGAAGASTPGLDKMTGLYSDFLEAAAYQNADGGLGLPYLSTGDIALATAWNLDGNNLTTLPNVAEPVHVYQLPGFILSKNIVNAGGISDATLSTGAMDGDATFTGIPQINAGTVANPIMIGTPNIGFIMELGNDSGYTVTLDGTNTYTGGTSILAGTLIVQSDASLGAAPTQTNAAFEASLTFSANGFPTNAISAVQADNGIIFNSLTEGNGTLTLGTATGGTFSTSRPIAVDSEAATINVNDNTVTLLGELISAGTAGTGIGNADGFSDLTIDDLSSADKGKLILSQASPYFYGNIIIGNTGKPTVEVMSDAALGNTTGPADTIGEVELNGGTFQVGADITATERNFFLGGGSTFDVNGLTSSWGTMTDVQRTLEVENSSKTTAGAVTFSNLTISATAILQLAGGTEGETVTLTNGVVQEAASDTLIIMPSGTNTLGSTEDVLSGVGASSLVNTATDGIAQAWMVENGDASKGVGPYDFLTYTADGYVTATYNSNVLTGATGLDIIALGAAMTATGNIDAFALNTEGETIALGGNTLTIGDGTTADAAGLILASGSAISNGTLAFGGSEGVIWLSGSNPTISAQITGSDGLTFSGSGAVAISTAASVSGAITVDSGTVTLSGRNIFATDVAGVNLADVKSAPAAATLAVSANNTLTSLNSVGNNSDVTLSSGAVLTIGDTINNLSSVLSSTITETGNATAGALTFAGSGLFDLSGGKISLVSGSSIDVDNTAQLRIISSEVSSGVTFDLASGSQLQFAQSGGGQFADAITGAGEVHLIGGTLQLTGTANTYTGGTVVETGSTLDLTTANVSSGNANITDAGGMVLFDQSTSGAYSGVISDGAEMGVGPVLSGSLDKDDSSGGNSSNVTLADVQAYTGATYVEAGTLTLGAVNTIAESSGVTLGRVGGAVDGQTATLALEANNRLTSLSDDASNTTEVQLNGNVLTLAPTSSSTSAYGGSIVDGSAAGSLVIDGAGTVTLSGDNSFTGGVTLDSGALDLAANASAGAGAITFGAANVDLVLGQSLTSAPTTAFADTLSNLAAGDQIDLTGLSWDAASATVAGNVLTVSNGTDSETFTLANSTATTFDATEDASGGVLVTAAICFMAGTRIRTPDGEVAVETLKRGDLVLTADGEAKPVTWLGRQTISTAFADPLRVWPIRVTAGALSEMTPSRDLVLSPDHALLVGGVLIHAGALVNGTSIRRETGVPSTFVYYHVELDDHALVLAENTPAETFVDNVDRLAFDNWAEHEALYPDGKPIEEMPHPRAKARRQVPKGIRAMLEERAGVIGAGASAVAA